MNCLTTSLASHKIDLLTQADKIDYLEESFAKYHRKHDLFLPDEDFYPEVVTPDSITDMANDMLHYLGIKHHGLSFHVDANQDALCLYQKSEASHSITLGWKCLEDSYVAAAALAHALCHHLLHARQKIHLADTPENEELTDLATIYAGFGILIANSFATKEPVLGTLAQPNYIAECHDYFNRYSIVASIWQPYVDPTIAQLFEAHLPPTKHYNKGVVWHQVLRDKHRKKFAILSVALGLLIIGCVGLYLNQPRYLSASMQTQKESIDLLKEQYAICEDTVLRKEKTWDTSDIFMQRQIDADKSRCASLRNRYNYEVSQFNQNL